MSIFIASNRVRVTNMEGQNVLDTNERFCYLHSKVSGSFQLPYIPPSSSRNEVNYPIATIPYLADFFIGYTPTKGLNLNGSVINEITVGYGATLRMVSFFLSSTTIYAKVTTWANQFSAGISSETIEFVFYAGNYDL